VNKREFQKFVKSYVFMIPGYRIKMSNAPRGDHWIGGKTYHEGAECPTCNRPLLLILDINCSDSLFVIQSESAFRDLERLPLYYCWGCGGDRSYRVESPTQIRVFGSRDRRRIRRAFPYAPYPSHLKKRRVRLDAFPAKIKAWLNSWQGFDGNSLSSTERQQISRFLGHKVSCMFDLWNHQLGGLPMLIQGPEQHACPYPRCGRHKSGEFMKILAAVHNDPEGGFPLVERRANRNHHANFWVQIVYHICPECFTIHAGNRCD
jgi:hypothetical protein